MSRPRLRLKSLGYSLAVECRSALAVVRPYISAFWLMPADKIRCTENYLELHETKNIYENPINQ